MTAKEAREKSTLHGDLNKILAGIDNACLKGLYEIRFSYIPVKVITHLQSQGYQVKENKGTDRGEYDIVETTIDYTIKW